MKASEAKYITDGAIPKIEKDLLEQTINKIALNASLGNYSVTINGGHLPDSVVERLTQLGYTIENSLTDPFTSFISWK